MTLTKAQFSDLIEDLTLNKTKFNKFVENYVSHIVEGLDVESLECMVFDLLIKEYETHQRDVGKIISEIEELYGEEVAADLLESASAV
jgi:hypothetical protein